MIMLDTQTEIAYVPPTISDRIVSLMDRGLHARSIADAVSPMLATLVEQTAAAGAAFFQQQGGAFFARAAVGELPIGPQMEAILAHGLPEHLPLLLAMERARAAVLQRYRRR